MTGASTVAQGTRNIELSVDIAAPPEAVWRAVSEGDRLANWFSPLASVVPGEGGSVTMGWAEDEEWTSIVSAWRPGEHLQLVDKLPEEAAADGAAPMVLDYFLDAYEGGTRVRLVNSGLSAGGDWDEFFYMMTNGWRVFLWNLKHYLERHPDARRTMISARPWVSGTREQVWEQVFREGGVATAVPPSPPTSSLAPGDPFRFHLDGTEAMVGKVVMSDRPWAFAGEVVSLNDGVLHVELEGSGERWRLGVWVSAYGVEEERCKEIGAALTRTMSRLFPGED